MCCLVAGVLLWNYVLCRAVLGTFLEVKVATSFTMNDVIAISVLATLQMSLGELM